MGAATAAPTRENVLYEKKGPIAYVTLTWWMSIETINISKIGSRWGPRV